MTTSRFNAANVFNWSDANVYIGALDAPDPTPGQPVDALVYDYVGALDGGAGFDTDRGSDQKKIKGWGTGTLTITDSNYEESVTFTTMEVNAVTQRLAYPGSDFSGETDGIGTATIKVPRLERFKLILEVSNGTRTQRKITANYAMLEGWPKETRTEDGVETKQFKVAVIADATKSLWKQQTFNDAAA